MTLTIIICFILIYFFFKLIISSKNFSLLDNLLSLYFLFQKKKRYKSSIPAPTFNNDTTHFPLRNASEYALINIPIASKSHPMYRPLLFSIIIMDINIPMIMNPKETMFNVELTITFSFNLRREWDSNPRAVSPT